MYRVLLNFAGGIDLLLTFFNLIGIFIFRDRIDSIFELRSFIIVLASSIIFLYAANKKDVNKSFYPFVLISAICNIFVCNLLSLILGIIGYCDLNKKGTDIKETIPPKPKKVLTSEEKELRKMRNILAIGVGLVVLAGIIFATSNWESMSGIMKTIILIVAAFLFLFVSILAEKKLNLKLSGMMYYGLSNVLIVVSLICAGYFEIFGNWFSLNGNGSNLFLSVIWLFIAVLSVIGYIKYNQKRLLYLIYFALLSVLYFSLLPIGDFNGLAFMIVSIIISIGAIVNGRNSYINIFNKFCKVILPLFTVILFFDITTDRSFIIFNLISFIAYSIAGYYLALVNNNEFFKAFAPMFTLVNAIGISLAGDTSSFVILIQIIIIALGIYSIGYYKKNDKLIHNVSLVLCNLAWLYVVIESIDLRYYYLAVGTAFILLLSSIVVSFDKGSGNFHFEKIIEPIKIFILSYSLYKLLGSFEFGFNASFIVIMTIIFLCMYLVRKNLIKFIYFIICLITTLAVFITSLDKFAPIECISLVVVSLILLISVLFTKEQRYFNFREGIYAFLLIAIFNMFYSFASKYEEVKLICILGTLISYMVAFLLVSRNNIMKLITIIAVFMPYYWGLETFYDLYINENNFRLIKDIKHIFSSLPCLVLIVVYTRGFLKSLNLNVIKVIEIVLLSIWYVTVLMRNSAEIGLFVGIIALISILIGYKSEKYISFYYTGILFTLINLFVQLKDIWRIVPIWAYILVAGLILIGVVTYKEYTKGSIKVKEVVPDIIEPGSFEVKKTTADTRTIIIGNIIYGVILFFWIISKL